mgnify:CR=1 FL=1
MAPILMAILPTIFKALASPLIAGTAASWLASKFGLSDSTVEAVTNFMNGLKPDDQIKLREIDIEFQKFLLDNGIKIDLAQIEVNKEEAKSFSKFIAGGRPFIMWVCGIAFAYVAILEPIMRFTAQVFFSYTGAFPAIDTALTLQVMLGLLGLGAMRSWEKDKDVQDKH